MLGERKISATLAFILVFSIVGRSFAVDPDHLDIRLNDSLLKSSPKKVSYGTIVHIEGLKDWEHSHVVDQAFQAHKKFVKQWLLDTDEKSPNRIQGLNRKKHRPTTTTTFVVDNTAYISTSLRGRGASYIYDMSTNNPKDDMAGVQIKKNSFDNTVIAGLRDCQACAIDTDRAHKNMANCGEFMAALTVCIDTNRRDLENARMVAIATDKDTGLDVIVPPCDNDPDHQLREQWGCTAFVFATDIKVLNRQHGRKEKEVSEADIKKGTRPQIQYP